MEQNYVTVTPWCIPTNLFGLWGKWGRQSKAGPSYLLTVRGYAHKLSQTGVRKVDYDNTGLLLTRCLHFTADRTAGCTTGWVNDANERSQAALERSSQDACDVIALMCAARRLCGQ